MVLFKKSYLGIEFMLYQAYAPRRYTQTTPQYGNVKN